jgi:tetratricopeptide (TPR) repeat protein
VEEEMHVFRRKAAVSRAAIVATVLALGAGIGTSVLAADPTPSDASKAPVISPAEPVAPAGQATPSAGAAASVEENPCFTGKGSIKDVLDGCAAFLASGSKDTDKLIAAHGNRAIGLSATGNFDAALQELDAAVALDPKQPNTYFMRAAAYDAKKDYDKAIADLDEAIRLDASRGDFYLLRGLVFSQKGELDRAIGELDQKVKLDPKSTIGFSKRAEMYRQKKDYDRAVADYTEVIKLEPDKATGYVDRGWIYVLKNDLDKALEDFTTTLKIHNNDASALVGIGLVKSRKGKPTDGSREIQQAITLEPGIIDQIKKLGVQ